MKKVKTQSSLRLSRKWHRVLGMAAALPLLLLSISGLLLNHADSLGLHERMVSFRWVVHCYGQMPVGEPVMVEVGERKIVEWDRRIFMDTRELALSGRLVGAVGFKDQLAIALEEVIGIYDGHDELVLTLDELSLPKVPITGIDVIDQRLLVQSGSTWYLLSEDFFSAQESNQRGQAQQPKKLSQKALKQLEDGIVRGFSIPLSRLIVDVHSGRLFGWPGWVITDLAALSLIFLIILGLRLLPNRRS